MVVKKSCVAAYPVGWPDGRGISGRMRVEWVAGSTWNRWSDAHGMGGQMTVESAIEYKSNPEGSQQKIALRAGERFAVLEYIGDVCLVFFRVHRQERMRKRLDNSCDDMLC